MTAPVEAWHFVGHTLRDGRPVPDDGVTLVHDGPLVMCSRGLHGSRLLLDALYYAPGSTVCRVTLGGEILRGLAKLVAGERTILWRIDGESVLRAFARRCALDVIDLWDAPAVVREYLTTSDESLRDAAWAASDAAWPASHAARAAAWAASDPAWAARDAAWAASDAASAAARVASAAARARRNRRLTAMVMAERRRRKE